MAQLDQQGRVHEVSGRSDRYTAIAREYVRAAESRLADDREIERAVEGSFAGLLQIDCAEDSTGGSLLPSP